MHNPHSPRSATNLDTVQDNISGVVGGRRPATHLDINPDTNRLYKKRKLFVRALKADIKECTGLDKISTFAVGDECDHNAEEKNMISSEEDNDNTIESCIDPSCDDSEHCYMNEECDNSSLSDDFQIANEQALEDSDSDSDYHLQSSSELDMDFQVASNERPEAEANKQDDKSSNESDDFEIANDCNDFLTVGSSYVAHEDPLSKEVKHDSNKSISIVDLSVFDFESDSSDHSCDSDFEIADNDDEGRDLKIDPQLLRSCCENNCCSKSFSDNVKSSLHSIVEEKRKIDIKNELLGHLKSQKRMGLSTCGFIFGGEFMCSKFFSQVSGLTCYIINQVLSDFEEGLVRYEHGNDGTFQWGTAATGFFCWMRSFADIYGQSAPDEEVLVLPSFLTIKDLFEIYKEEAEEPKIKCSTFYSLFKKCFGWNRVDRTLPQIRLSAWSTHSKCDQCIALNRYKRSCRTEESISQAKSLKMAHKECYGKARMYIESRRHLALNFPSSRLFIQIDDMGVYCYLINIDGKKWTDY